MYQDYSKYKRLKPIGIVESVYMCNKDCDKLKLVNEVLLLNQSALYSNKPNELWLKAKPLQKHPFQDSLRKQRAAFVAF